MMPKIHKTYEVGYKRQGERRGKRAVEEEMGLFFPPAYIHGTAINFDIFGRINSTLYMIVFRT